MIQRITLIILFLWPLATWAEFYAPAGQSLLQRPTGALIAVRATTDVAPVGQTASLFIGQSGGSLFAPLPARTVAPRASKPASQTLALRGTPVERIRQLIQYAESRRDGYDAVQYGATVKPGKRPTEMTLAEIFAWIEETPGQPHAIGRYQFIPPTLRSLVKKLELDPSTRFSPDIQDRLADVLLIEAGLHAVQSGAMRRTAFMTNLAKIWAGFPTENGKSVYDGYAGNKASITWAEYDAEMGKIFPR